MKKLSLLFIIIVIVISACQESTAPVDVDAEKAIISEMFVSFENLMMNQNTDSLLTYLSEDLLAYGTDPEESWNKEGMEEIWDYMAGQDFPDMEFIGEKVVKVAPDGKSAIVIEQFNISYTPNIPWRNVYYLLKTDGEWIISFWSTALIPKNEDLAALSKAVAVEE